MDNSFDVIIIGAGPAGCACAHQLSGNGLRILILEKERFPRDKICGDGLTADIGNQLYLMDEDLGKRFEEMAKKQPSYGVRFYAPNHKHVDISYTTLEKPRAGFYVAKRVDFDNFLYAEIKRLPDVTLLEDHPVSIVEFHGESVSVKTDKRTFTGKIVVGADGAHSVINKQINKAKIDRNHYSAGIRQYFKNVQCLPDNHHMELHFYKEILPGYLWIFPLPNGHANVGLGILSSEVSKKKIDLKAIFNDLLQNHPNLKDRFKDATPTDSIRGFGLPLGSKKMDRSGERYLLLGDAASLIDPFTGEGIGNALRSGRVAAAHILEGTKEKRFDASFNQKYDQELQRRMGMEFRLSRSVQNLMKYPTLFNFVVNKANKNESVRLLLNAMLDDVDLRSQIKKPSFYWKLLFS